MIPVLCEPDRNTYVRMLDPDKQRRQIFRLSIVAAVVLVLCGGIYTLYLLNSQQNSRLSDEQRIASAREAYEQADYEEVVRLFENPASRDSTIQAIQQDPELLRMYIEARQEIPLYNQRHLSRIVTPLTQLAELDPSDLGSKRLLIDTLLDLERNDEALEKGNQFAEQHPEDAPLLRQLGQALLRKGQFDTALETLGRSTLIEPLHVQTYAQMRDLIQQYEQPIEPFIGQAAQVFSAHPNNPQAMMIQALSQEVQGNGVQARDLIKEAGQLAPGDASVVPLLTQWLDQYGLVVEATRYLLQYAETGVETPAGRMAIYRAFEVKDYTAILDRLADATPAQANSDLLGMWITAHLQAGEPDIAETLLQDLAQRDNAIAVTWAKLLELEQNEATAPAKIIDTIIPALQDGEDRGIQTMARRHPYFMQRLGEAYLQALEPEAAYSAFSVAASNSSSWARPHLSLAETLIKLGQPAGALVHAREAQLRVNNDAARRWLTVAMANSAKPTDQAAVDRVLKEADQVGLTPDSDGRLLASVVGLLARADRQEEAKQRMNAALDHDATSSKLLEALLRVSQQQSLGLEAKITDQIESRFGVTPGLALIQAEGIASDQGGVAGRRAFEEASLGPMTKAWQTTLAEYLVKSKAEDAAAYLAGLAEQYPDDLKLQLAALKAGNPIDQVAFFEATIPRLRELAGESSIHWRLQQARIAMLNPEDRQALGETAESLGFAQGLAPTHLELRLVSARCYMLLGDYENAADRAQAAKSIASNHPQAMLLNGMALHRLERLEEARLDLIPLATNPRIDPATRLKACVLLNEQGEYGPVRQAVEQMWAAGQANNQLLTMLARIYSSAGEFAKADRVCEALTKVPQVESIRFVSAYYHQTNRPELAEKAIKAAQDAGLGETDRLMVLAEDAAHRGDTDTALQLVEQAATTEQQAGRWEEAVQLALSLAKPQDAIRLARLGLETNPDEAGLAAIVRLGQLILQIEADASLIPIAVTILRHDEYHVQAVRVLEIAAEQQDQSSSALALAQLAEQHPGYKYLSELAGDRLLQAGRTEQAHELSKKAMVRFPRSAAAARVAALTSFRLQDWPMLLSSANAWAERNPGDRGNADLMRAAAMTRLDRFTTAINTLEPYIQAQIKVDAGNRLLFEYHTYALIKNGESDAAWLELTPHLSTSRQARQIALKRVSEDVEQATTAVDWLKQIASLISNDAEEQFELASAYFLAGQRLNDDPLIRQADQRMAVLLATPGPHPMQWQYAQGQIAQSLGRLDRAEASYRGVMVAKPDNPLVLNNLALVLAEQGPSSLDEAEQLANRATQLAPEDPNLLDTLAMIQLRRARYDDALKTIEKAIKLDGASPDWRLTQADIYDAKGEPERAAVIRERYTPRLRD
ncbi:MAG: tetratricopeptide repeat protein [Planctomycetota bacterium]